MHGLQLSYGKTKLYQQLGGARNHLLASLLVFLFCGFVFHDLPFSILTARPNMGCTLAFFCWWCLSELNRRGYCLPQGGRRSNVVFNVTAIVVGLLGSNLLIYLF